MTNEHHEGSLSLTGTGNPTPDLGRHAYEAYCAATGWKSLASGGDLPSWDDQGEEYRAAWQMAATAVARVILD